MQRASEEGAFLRAAGQRTRQDAVDAVRSTVREVQAVDNSIVMFGDTEDRFSFSVELSGEALEGDEAIVAFLRRFGPR